MQKSTSCLADVSPLTKIMGQFNLILKSNLNINKFYLQFPALASFVRYRLKVPPALSEGCPVYTILKETIIYISKENVQVACH